MLESPPGSIGYLFIGVAVRPTGQLQFEPIGREDGGAPIPRKILGFGVHDHRLAGLPSGIDGAAYHRVRQHSLRVVGQHDHIDIAERGRKLLQQAPRHLRRQRLLALAIRAHHLLPVGNVAGFERCRARVIGNQRRTDRGRQCQLSAQVLGPDIGADHTQESDLGTERRDVACDIGRAARHVRGALDVDHRYRGFRGDSLHRAVDEAIEHDIAEHQDPCRVKSIE